jgi:NAD(P)-dependent dehydrogenase (short-subunit alcohol dehydrogenase family)
MRSADPIPTCAHVHSARALGYAQTTQLTDCVICARARRYKIFALCLRDDSCSKINALNETADPKYGNEVVGVQVDVTSDSSVSAAVSGAVLPWLNESSDRILHAVVNNAGIGTPGFVDMLNVQPAFSSPHSYRNDMEVNFYGMIRLTQATLPILKAQSTRKSASRYRRAIIVNVTSMAGLVASPNMSAYTCSKVRALSGALPPV